MQQQQVTNYIQSYVNCVFNLYCLFTAAGFMYQTLVLKGL